MLHVVRAIFLILSFVLGGVIGNHVEDPLRGALIGGGIGISALLLEAAFSRRFIGVISVLMFGVVVGFVLAHFLIALFHLIPAIDRTLESDPSLRLYTEFATLFFASFLSMLTILHSKDEFKFVIPFVELKREGASGRPLLVDTSVIIDGRIADIIETRIIDAKIIIPRFVLLELQQVADSSDKGKRMRGRRGLDMLQRMQKSAKARIEIQEVTFPEVEGVDAKLVHMARKLDAFVVTTDFNLNKVAQVQGVEVININDLANALRPSLLPGDRLVLRIAKPGETAGQGVGYLEDGTMVVAEECGTRIGQDVELVITNALQTSAGRLIFGRPAPRA